MHLMQKPELFVSIIKKRELTCGSSRLGSSMIAPPNNTDDWNGVLMHATSSQELEY
jgi:hypothetical protein